MNDDWVHSLAVEMMTGERDEAVDEDADVEDYSNCDIE